MAERDRVMFWGDDSTSELPALSRSAPPEKMASKAVNARFRITELSSSSSSASLRNGFDDENCLFIVETRSGTAEIVLVDSRMAPSVNSGLETGASTNAAGSIDGGCDGGCDEGRDIGGLAIEKALNDGSWAVAEVMMG